MATKSRKKLKNKRQLALIVYEPEEGRPCGNPREQPGQALMPTLMFTTIGRQGFGNASQDCRCKMGEYGETCTLNKTIRMIDGALVRCKWSFKKNSKELGEEAERDQFESMTNHSENR
jgi:hypothetical protein